jgi:hypothetical protein
MRPSHRTNRSLIRTLDWEMVAVLAFLTITPTLLVLLLVVSIK